MTSEFNNEATVPKESALVEIKTEDDIIEELRDRPESMSKETIALVDALKKRALSEMQAAGNFSREAYMDAVHQASETYLSSVRQARSAIEQETPLIEKDRIEYTLKLMQMEAEKNWEFVIKDISTLGDRLADAAKAAWDVLTAPRDDSSNV